MLEQEPQTIKKLVAKDRRVDFCDKEDCEQAVLLQLLKKRTIERYDVGRRGGIGGVRLFYHYVVKCIRNEISTYCYVERRAPTNHAYTLRIRERHSPTYGLVDFLDDIMVNHTDHLHRQVETAQLYGEFETYVREHRPKLLPALHEWLSGMTGRESKGQVWSHRRALRDLYKKFNGKAWRNQ